MAVSSYARMELLSYKMKVGKFLLYTDTDSIYSLIELSKDLIGDSIGQMKLECIATKAVFIAPKVYGLILEDGTEIIKIKGSKKNHGVTVAYLESLLTKDATIELNQEKWFRNITESLINIRSTLYTLKVTENKRQLVYLDDIFVDTKPLIIENGVIKSTGALFLSSGKNLPVLYNINFSEDLRPMKN
jgi:uncharacterized protein YbcV (DUF1398 family)